MLCNFLVDALCGIFSESFYFCLSDWIFIFCKRLFNNWVNKSPSGVRLAACFFLGRSLYRSDEKFPERDDKQISHHQNAINELKMEFKSKRQKKILKQIKVISIVKLFSFLDSKEKKNIFHCWSFLLIQVGSGSRCDHLF